MHILCKQLLVEALNAETGRLGYTCKAVLNERLVDADGNIVAKNLYGEELERKLSKLLK